MSKTKQIIVIHGGSSFTSYDAYLQDLKETPLNYDRMLLSSKWRNWLPEALPEADVLLPNFPNAQNAQYNEWKIVFEKILPFLTAKVSLVGYSLGAMFLAKYLHENPFTQPVQKLILVAPCYNDESIEDLGSFKIESATGLEKSAKEIHLFHSQDDPVSPYSELEKFQKDIPTAHTHTFPDRNHFFQPTFPELVEVLRPSDDLKVY